MSTAERKAVFLSYASQDAEAARRIAEALRAEGVEVWFDVEGGLEHGDEWDAKIRRQIKDCVLFLAVISRNTQARHEGYFRIEWELAAQRALGIASGVAFILPVVIDDTREPEALVPDRFRAVQWTRLPNGHVSPDVLARFVKLWSHRTGALKYAAGKVAQASSLPSDPDAGIQPALPLHRRRVPAAAWTAAAAIVVVAVAIAFWSPWSGRAVSPTAPVASAPQTEVEKLLTQVWALYEKQDDATGQDWTLAEDLAAQAVKRESNNADAWAAYSQATLGAWVFGYDRTVARLAEARSRAERAVGLAPESFEARFAVANCHRRQVATRVEAEKVLRALVAERPTDKRVIRMLAQTLRDFGRTEEALEWLDRAAALPGGDPIAVWGKFAVYSAAGLYEEAEAAVTQSLAIRRGPSALLRQVAVRLVWHGDLDGAAAALREVPGPFLLKAEGVYVSYQLARWRRDPNACLAALQLAGGDMIEGSNYLPSTNSAVPTGLWRGDAYALAGNRDAAEKNWRDALAVVEGRAREQPGENGWIFWRASLQARLGERTEGLRSYRLYQQLTGAGAGSSGNFGFSRTITLLAPLIWLGEIDEALAHVEKGMAAAPTQRRRDLIRHELLLDPLYDGLRENPRFRALVAAPAVGALAKPDAKSVAVLAFENRSSEKDSEYFSDGVSDELIDVLGRVAGLKVIARTSSFAFKGNKAASAQEIARALGVTHLVEGSVQQAGGKARVIARLIRAETGEQVWGGRFEPDIKDVFAAQSDVAKAIAQALSLQLGVAEAGGRRAVNPEALQLYLQGRQLWSLRLPEAVDRAEGLFQQALRLDPGLAQARSGLADVWLIRGIHRADTATRLGNFADRRSPEIGRVIAEAKATLVQDSSLAEAHATIGNALSLAWDFPGALGSLRRAIELNPNYASAHLWMGRAFFRDGRMPEGIAALAEAAQLDPLSPIILDNYALGLVFSGRPADALTVIERALLLRPDHPQTLAWKIWALADLGRKEEALKLAQLVKPTADDDNLAFAVADALRAAGETGEADTFARQQAGYRRFIAMAGSGQPAEGLPFLDPPKISSLIIHYLLFLPALDPVRSDPRFVSAIEALGLTEAHTRAQAWRAANPATRAERK